MDGLVGGLVDGWVGEIYAWMGWWVGGLVRGWVGGGGLVNGWVGGWVDW